MTRRRSVLDLRMEILEAAMEGEKPTRLMYKTNQSWKAMYPHLDVLQEHGLLEEIRIQGDRRSRVIYKTTMKGIEILKAYQNQPLFFKV